MGLLGADIFRMTQLSRWYVWDYACSRWDIGVALIMNWSVQN